MTAGLPMVGLLLVNWKCDRHIHSYYASGFTPLSVAINRHHWSTAKLILAISAAQYVPYDENDNKFKISDINLGGSTVEYCAGSLG